MPPLLSMETWSERGVSAIKLPRKRCFIIAEGANTEYRYFTRLAVLLSKQWLPHRIELVPVQRTGDDRNKSNPRALLEQAKRICDGDVEGVGFEEGDRVLIVFDADVFKGDKKRYADFLSSCNGIADVAVTNPSFELFLMLHIPGAYQNYIKPHAGEILKNGHYPGTHHRFVSRLAHEVLGMNVKSNAAVGDLAEKYMLAIKQESNLNQDPVCAMGSLTSNVGAAIERLIREGA